MRVADASARSTPVALPQWYARFSLEPAVVAADFAASRYGEDGNARVGPFTVFRCADGCDVATFGSTADPGAVLFDGYLFDRAATRRDLGLDVNASDATIAAAAYQRWGLDVFDRLDGSYLIAIWDPLQRRLLLGHDPLGHHPVFYADRPDAFWFTSNVLAMPAAGVVPNEADRVSFAMAALLYWPAAGHTFYQQVQRLRPGHYLSVTADRAIRETHYWSPWLDDDEPGLTEKQAWEQFEPMIVDAIGRCMELSPDSIMLSGGLDSVTIAALAADHSRTNGSPLIRAVSGRRDFPPSDEEPMQTAVAAALRMEHLVARESEWIGTRSGVDLSLDAVRELPGPSRIYWAGPYMAFYRFVAARGVSIALTGSGGDNWVSVGDAFAAHAMRQLHLGALARHVRSWMGTGGLTFKAAARHLLWSGGLRLLLDSYSASWVPSLKAQYHRRRAVTALPDWLCPDRTLKEEVTDTLYGQRPAALTPTGRVPRNFYRHAQRSTVNPYFQYEFEVGFHVESACGLRLLSPYHDKRVVRFLNSIPPEVLLHGESYKGMLRPVAEARLPALGLGAQRKVYGTGVREAQQLELQRGVGAAWPRHGLERLSALGVVDATAAQRRFAAVSGGGFSDFVRMYALMSGDRWLAAHT